MNQFQIQNALFYHLVRKGFQLSCPNYTPLAWWECDVFAVTEAGCFVEFEIKTSRADYLKDAKKADRPGKPTKHECLAMRDHHGPGRFFFVVPKGLVKPEEIPEWAGFIEIDSLQFRVVKEAPFLHKVKVSEKRMEHVRGVFYWRFWNLRRGYKPDDCGQPADKADEANPGASDNPLETLVSPSGFEPETL